MRAGVARDGDGADVGVGVVLAVRAGRPPAGARRPAGRPARGVHPVPGAVDAARAAAAALAAQRRARDARHRRRGTVIPAAVATATACSRNFNVQ